MKLTKSKLKQIIKEETEEALNEDAMDMTVLQGFMQIIDNFAPATYPAIIAAAAMSGKEISDAVKSYAAKKAKVNIKR